MDKFEVLKKIYDTTEDKEKFLDNFDEVIRDKVKECLDKGDLGLFKQLCEGTSLESGECTMTVPTSEEVTTVDEVAAPEGDVTDKALQDVVVMDEDIKKAEDEEIQALPESIKEGAMIWKDASEDFSKAIVSITSDILRGTDFSEGDVLVTGATVAKDLQDSGYGKTSLSKAMEEIDNKVSLNALNELYTVREELEGLKSSVEEVVDYVTDKDNLGLTPSAKERLVDIILENGIFVNDPQHDVREDIKSVVSSSGDYSVMEDSVKDRLVDNLYGYEFSMEEALPLTQYALSMNGNYKDTLKSVNDSIDFLENSSKCDKSGCECSCSKNKGVDSACGDTSCGDSACGRDTSSCGDNAEDTEKEPNKLSKARIAAASLAGLGTGFGLTYLLNRNKKNRLNNLVVSPKLLGNFSEDEEEPKKLSKAKIAALSGLGLAGTGLGVNLLLKKNKKDMTDAMREVLWDYKVGAFSESNDNVVSDQILNSDEVVESLSAKYASLPTLEAKEQMVKDMRTAELPEEYINAIIGRSTGEFSEVLPPTPQQVVEVTDKFGTDELAGADETTTTDEFDGTLPGGVVTEEGVTQVERMKDTQDESFENII